MEIQSLGCYRDIRLYMCFFFTMDQGLSQDFKSAYLKQQTVCPSRFSNSELLQILIPTTFESLLYENGQFTHQPYVYDDGLLGKDLSITPQNNQIWHVSIFKTTIKFNYILI